MQFTIDQLQGIITWGATAAAPVLALWANTRHRVAQANEIAIRAQAEAAVLQESSQARIAKEAQEQAWSQMKELMQMQRDLFTDDRKAQEGRQQNQLNQIQDQLAVLEKENSSLRERCSDLEEKYVEIQEEHHDCTQRAKAQQDELTSLKENLKQAGVMNDM